MIHITIPLDDQRLKLGAHTAAVSRFGWELTHYGKRIHFPKSGNEKEKVL